jgi:tetratricopeptide (TPR) repeat protein
MSKLDYVQQKKLNPADELRELIETVERRRPALGAMNSVEALDLLQTLDQAYLLFHQLETAGLNLLPEQGRFGAIQNSLKNKANTILKALGGPEALAEHRPQPAPERERWWWYLHEMVAARNQYMLKRFTIAAVLVLLILGGVFLAFETVLAPSPETVARLDAENDGLARFEEGNYQEALVAVEKGLSVVPDDANLLIFKGILEEVLGQEGEAAQAFQAAQAGLAADPTAFYLGRGQLYLRIGELEKAKADVQQALAIDEKSSLAWLLLGQVLESQNEKFESMSAYERASELALADNNFQVVVLARLGLGRMGMVPPPLETTATPQE